MAEILKVDEVIQQNSAKGPFWVGKVGGKTYRFKSEVKAGDEVYGEITESTYDYKGKPVTSRWVEVKQINKPQPPTPTQSSPPVPQSYDKPTFGQIMAAIKTIKNELGWTEVDAEATAAVMQTVILRIGAREIMPPMIEADPFEGDAHEEYDASAPPWERGD